MDELEMEVHSALAQLNSVLADLYARGVEFSRDPSRPGQVHLISHIGREVSRSLLRIVGSELPRDSTLDDADLPLGADFGQSESMRIEIGRALGLHPDHQVVRAWYGVHRAFQSQVHLGESPQPLRADNAILAFKRLTRFLHSRLAPYFTAEDTTLSLLSRPPRHDDAEALHSIFFRAQLRYRFFSECRSPLWVEFLDRAGFFVAPSAARGAEAQPIPWPEGTALVNIAAGSPALVSRILQDPRNGLGRHNRNPIVTDQVCRVIENLPVGFMKRHVPTLVSALRHGASRYAAVASFNVAQSLARECEAGSIALTEAILGLRRLPEGAGTEGRRLFSTPTYELLECAPDYYVTRLLEDVVPVIAGFDPLRIASVLIERLDRAEHLLAQAGYADAEFSHHWLNRWESSRAGREDLRADLARAADGIAGRVLNAIPDWFTEWDALLSGRSSHVMRRLRLRFIIATGAPYAAEAVDQTLRADWVLDPCFGAREVADLLRRHFAAAGADARASFVSRLEQGPNEEWIRFTCEMRGHDPESREAREACIANWQAQRLRWFRGDLPADFAALADRLGFDSAPVDEQQQDLDEVGHWSSGAVWSGDASPLSVEDLRLLSDETIIGFLTTWEPTAAQRFDGPNRQGLADRLRQLLSEELRQRGGFVRQLATHSSLHAEYLGAGLAACTAVLNDSPRDGYPWEEALLLARVAIEASPDNDSTFGHRHSLWARREALRFLREASKGPTIPALHAPTFIGLVGISVATAPRWALYEGQGPGSFESLGITALNQDAGLVVDLIVSACRFLKERNDHGATESDSLVAGWLDEVVSWDGPNALGARWQLGHHLPALLHFADGWVQANETTLLEQGMADPGSAPTWGAYLVSYGIYDNVFRRLEPWYRSHGRRITTLREWEASSSNQGDDQRPSRHFVEHVGMALLRGLITFDTEDDGDLRQVLAQSPGEDRAHFAWLVVRALDDAEGSLQEGFTDRLVRYWAWRLMAIDELLEPEDGKELDALGWFIRVEQLAPEATIDLALRTLEKSSSYLDVRRHVWQALPRFVAIDPVKSVRMVEALAAATLQRDYGYVDYNEASPVLRAILNSGSPEARERVVGVVNRLGEAGWSEFRGLLA